jgi:hypothetical protein
VAAMKIALVMLAIFAVLAGAYGWVQHKSTQELITSRQQLQDSLAQSRSQTEALTARVNALSAAQEQEAAARAQAEAAKKASESAIAEGGKTPTAHHSAPRRRADDPRWKQLQQQLGEHQKALDENKQQLAETQSNLEKARSELAGNLDAARNELGGGIARNHDELVALQRKGERNYFEFDLNKAKGYHHTGPISISLRKADTKREYCDLELLVNDAKLSRKHISLYESVAFYPEGYALPLELVINRIGKDFVHGYVSEPKYRPAVQATVAANSSRTEPAKTPGPLTTHSPEPANPPPPAVPDPQLERRSDTDLVH